MKKPLHKYGVKCLKSAVMSCVLVDKVLTTALAEELVDEILEKAIQYVASCSKKVSESSSLVIGDTAAQGDVENTSSYMLLVEEYEETRFKREEQEEVEVQVIEPDYDNECEEGTVCLQPVPKQGTFWSAGDDRKTILPKAPLVGGRGDTDPPSNSTQESQKKPKQRRQERHSKKWKLTDRMRKLFSMALGRNSKPILKQ